MYENPAISSIVAGRSGGMAMPNPPRCAAKGGKSAVMSHAPAVAARNINAAAGRHEHAETRARGAHSKHESHEETSSTQCREAKPAGPFKASRLRPDALGCDDPSGSQRNG